MAGEIVVSAQTAEYTKKKLTPTQDNILKAILGSKTKTIEQMIPSDIAVEDFKQTLPAVCIQLGKAAVMEEVLIPALGRLMLLAQQREELWNDKYDKYDDFVAGVGAETGYKRTSLYEFRHLADRWSHVVEGAGFQRIGRVKLKRIGGVIDKGKEDTNKAKELLSFAETHTLEELDEMLDKKYHTGGAAAATGAYNKYPCNKKQAKEHAKWFSTPEVMAFATSLTGKKSIGTAEIIDAMIAECSTEWLKQGAQIIESVQEEVESTEAEEAVEA